VAGSSRASALVVRVGASNAGLDAAVAQTRALLHRMGLARADDEAEKERRRRERLAESLDPRARLVRLWRDAGEEATVAGDALGAFADATLKDEGLVIVAARPGRVASP
jgi:hypothetical protein